MLKHMFETMMKASPGGWKLTGAAVVAADEFEGVAEFRVVQLCSCGEGCEPKATGLAVQLTAGSEVTHFAPSGLVEESFHAAQLPVLQHEPKKLKSYVLMFQNDSDVSIEVGVEDGETFARISYC